MLDISLESRIPCASPTTTFPQSGNSAEHALDRLNRAAANLFPSKRIASAALAAAMDVMLMLDATKLDQLHDYFLRNENQLSLDDFVAGMLHFFPSDKVRRAPSSRLRRRRVVVVSLHCVWRCPQLC
jgi:hypothetical protein